MEPENRELLIREAGSLGVELGPEQADLMEKYLSFLNRWADKMNLTSIREEKDQVIKLVLDSLALAPVIRAEPGGEGIRMLDLGSGAGAPGVPVKVSLPEVRLTMVESRGKRASFLRNLAAFLGLPGVEVFQGRAEDFSGPAQRVVTARAFGKLGDLARTGGPLLRACGALVAMKGPRPEDEIQEHEGAIAGSGFLVEEVKPYQLPGAGGRSLVIMRKQ